MISALLVYDQAEEADFPEHKSSRQPFVHTGIHRLLPVFNHILQEPVGFLQHIPEPPSAYPPEESAYQRG